MNYLIRTTLVLLGLLSSSLLAEQTPVYFGTSQSKGIYTATLDTDLGTLSPLTLAAEIAGPGFIAIHPNQPCLYATTNGFKEPNTAGVAAYRIRTDHSLELINKLPSGGRGACHLSIDATGQALVVAHYSSGSAAAFRINDDGSLAATDSLHTHSGSGEHPTRQKAPHPHSAFFHPNNQFVYVPDLGIDKVIIYQFDAATGTLAPAAHATVPGGSQGPRHMKFSADGQYAYVLNELSLNVATFSVNPNNGHLTHMDTVSVWTEDNEQKPDTMTCAEIRMHPSGKWLYTSTRDLHAQNRDTLSTFKIEADGSATLIANTHAAVHFPRNFNIDPSGQWLIVGGQKSSTLTIFAINTESGALTLKQSEIPFDGGMICVEFIQ